MSRSPIVQGARSAEDIPGRCDVTNICDWRIWQSIYQTSSDLLVLDTRDVVEKYVVDNVYRIESIGTTVRQSIWERLFESTNYILEVVKLSNIHLFNTPHKRQRTNTSGLVSSLKSQTATFSRDCTLHLSFVMGTSMNISLRESTISTITGSQRVTQNGHQIGHCSMPRRCHRGAR